MLKCLFLIAVTSPILVYSDDAPVTTIKPSELECYEEDNVKLALTAFLAQIRTGINQTLEQKSNENLTSTLITAADEVVVQANDVCLKKKSRSQKYNYTDFITLLDFSLRDQKYYNFTITGGKTCINETRSKISQCINGTIGYTNDTEMPEIGKLFKKSQLYYSFSTCIQSRQLKNCTERVLKNNTNCEKYHVEYVTSLFNFAIEHSPCVQLPSKFKPRNSASSILFNSAVMMIALIIAL